MQIQENSYFSKIFSSDAMHKIFNNEKLIQSWLDTETALALAQAKCGIIPREAANEIKIKANFKNLDIEKMKEEFLKVGFPILPMVKQLTNCLDNDSAGWVHYGATTQDILDTGMVLQIREGLELIEQDIDNIIVSMTTLAKDHRNTVMAGRTFQQLASPITFGYKVAIWLAEMLRHRKRLEQLKPRLLIGQIGGAVGTFATLGDKGLVVQKEMMAILGLGCPDITWHTSRDGWAELISFFAMLAATLAKIGNEISILMRTEVGELREPFKSGRGASTTMPQKRNPVLCQPIIAIAHKLRSLSSDQFGCMIQEHERGVGQMHLEWLVIPEAFLLISGALNHMCFLMENLEVDTERMRKNLQLNGGLIMTEAVMMKLAPKIGKHKAHELLYLLASKAQESKLSLQKVLLDEAEIMKYFSPAEIESLLDPSNYTGVAGEMVDSVLELVKNQGIGS